MTPGNPQLLDSRIYSSFEKAAAQKLFGRMLEIMTEASEALERASFSGDPGTVSAGTVINVLTDSVRILSGDVGTLPRKFSRDFFDDEEAWASRAKWLRRIYSLEHLATAIGVELGQIPTALREEFADMTGETCSLTDTDRLFRLWHASRPFLVEWPFHGLLRPLGPYELSHPEDHRESLEDLMAYAFGLEENWTSEAKARFEFEMSYVETLHSEIVPRP